MGRLKLVELVILTVSTLVTAAKAIVKFIDYLGKFRHKPATGTA